ncbi:MAG TPA: branched-chain amino acid ABC transporter permease/ATP-binding protein [Acidimicrobiales bacterium]|nr:branched-chain amino acid ABC transporter permease/ATP-binding protein [Acidimicrobiales bacterium]
MSEFLKFLLLGLGAGGVYALLALGIVLVYRGSGIVNFANGGLALLAAGVFYDTRDSLGTAPSIALSVAAAAAAGALIQVLIMRPMRHSSPLARVIATLGLMSLFQQAAVKRYGTNVPFVKPFLSTGTYNPFGDLIVSKDRIVIFAVTVALTAVLWLFYRYTSFGLATTGVAENERATAALGWSPNIVATCNWAAGGALAGLAGVLLVPIIGLSPTALTLTIVPALSAALVGGFASFPLTLLGGLTIGVLESLATRYVHTPGWSTAVPFLVIILILVVRGRALPLRSHITDRLPKVGTGEPRWIPIAVTFAVVLASFSWFTDAWDDAVTTSVLFAFICLSLVVVVGYCGQLSLAQYSLAGVGALISSRLADAAGVPFLLAILLGVVLTIPAGLLVALPAVRARGVNLAVATLGLAVVITSVLLGNPDYTGGVIRGTVVPKASLFGWDIFSVDHPNRYAGFSMVLLLVCCIFVANVRRGRTGRRLIAVRNNERAAASLGISIVGAKLYAFGLGAAIAALGGSLMAFRNQNVNFNLFDVFGSIQAVLVTVIGSIGFITGALVGGASAIAGVAQEILSHFFDVAGWFALISAALLIVVVIRQPDGVAAQTSEHVEILRRKVGGLVRRRGAAPAVAAATDGADAPDEAAEPSAPAPAPVIHRVEPRTLRVEDVTVQFGVVRALDGVSLEVRPGEIVGLIGPNGAGKTTLIDAATGFHRQYSGRVLLDDRSIDRLRAHRRVRGGVTRSFQSLELFDDLSVRDNLRAASDPRDSASYFTNLVHVDRRPLSDATVASIREFGLEGVLDNRPSELPYAQRRLVAIARAVAASPSVLLLDEPAAGLDDVSREELARLIRRLAADWGMAVLLVEHDVSMVLRTCDRVVALHFGKVLSQGSPDEVRNHPGVIEAYLGTSVDSHGGPSAVATPV